MKAGQGTRRLVAGLVSCAMFALAAPPAQASLAWDTSAYNFGNQTVGTSGAHTFTLTATCDGGFPPPPMGPPPPGCAMPIGGIHIFFPVAVSGEGFALSTPNSCMAGSLMVSSFPGSMSCQTAVSFTLGSAGAKTGALTTTGPDITLSGTGVVPSAGGGSPGGGSTGGSQGGVQGQTGTSGKKCKKKKKSAAAARKKCKKKKK